MGTALKKSRSTAPEKSFLVCGDEILVREYSELLSRADAHVYVWNDKKPELPNRKNLTYTRSLNRIPKKLIAAFELTNTSFQRKIDVLKKIENHCAKETLIISSTLIRTVTDLSTRLRHPHRLVGIAAFPTFINNDLLELSRGPLTHTGALKAVGEIIFDYNKEISLVDDRVAMVMPRILCCLINEATFALQEEVSSAEDIDTAMKLGTNYPHGPVEWGENIGFDQVLAVMEALHGDTGEERYRPSPLLRKLAAGRALGARFLH